MFALAIGAPLAAVWPLAIQVIFGGGYSQAANVGLLGIASFMPQLVGTSLMAGILVGRRTLPLLLTGGIQAAVIVGVALLTIPTMGFTGFFIAQGIAGIIQIFLRLIVLGAQTGTSSWRPWMAPLLVATLAFSGLLVLDTQVAESALQRVAVATVALAILYLWITFVALSSHERNALANRVRHEIKQAKKRFGEKWGKGRA
jgi:hypothetical protein